MGSGIYIATSGAVAQDTALRTTSNNIANVATVGFRGQQAVFAEALATARSQDAAFVGTGSAEDDISQGPIVQTYNPLDLALVGDGYFAVETDRGVRYTRAGNFRLDADSKLVDGNGYAVMGQGGGTIAIPPGTATVTVDARGAVYADGQELGRIELARFVRGSLTREGNNLFVARGQPVESDEGPEVVSGSLEQSNVNVVRGMVSLVRISRTYEALMRMVEAYQATETRTARSLGSSK